MRLTCVSIVWFVISGFLIAQESDSSRDGLGAIRSLQTVAEQSRFSSTASQSQVGEFLKKLDEYSLQARLDSIGETVEGRALHALILGRKGGLDLPLQKDDRRLVVFLLGGIHSGENDGKEALLALARDSLSQIDNPWWEKLVLVIIPNFNADGNERIGPLHRPGQVGPTSGMGVRENAQNLDLNRDFVKLVTPEVRSLVKAIDHYKADVLIDLHTTNGSLHRYDLTYAVAQNPAAYQPLVEWQHKVLLPQATARLEKKGIHSFYYGNFSPDHQRWETFGHEPRYSTEYMGMRGRIGILSESYSYASYQQRIQAGYEFVQACLDILAANQSEIQQQFLEADNRCGRTDEITEHRPRLPLQAERHPADEAVAILGYRYSDSRQEANSKKQFPGPADRLAVDRLTPENYRVQLWNKYVASIEVNVPQAYAVPMQYAWAVDRLKMHGVQVHQINISKPAEKTKVGQYRIKEIKNQTVQGLTLRQLEVDYQVADQGLSGEYFWISTNQPLGMLASYLLEPHSDDSLAAWGFLEGGIEKGRVFPILRIEQAAALDSRASISKLDRIPASEKLSIEGLFRPSHSISLGSLPPTLPRWLSDSTEYLLQRHEAWYAVDALTGSMRPFDRLQRLNASLAKLDAFDDSASRNRLASINTFNADFSLALVEHKNDLFLFDAATDQTRKITHSPTQSKRFAELSPSGRHVAYVHENNLYVVDCQSIELKQWTHDGNDEILNGVLDWVYQEEIYGRGIFKAFWWSPDGRKLAFLQLDERPVDRYQVLDSVTVKQSLEETRYPKSGAALPIARVMTIDLDTRKLQTMNLDDYQTDDRLIARVHWHPDSQKLILQIQNRIQSWLDLVECDVHTGAAKRLFRKQSSAWIDVIDQPHWLPGGDFLWLSDMPLGRRHLFRISRDGSQRTSLTKGDWDVEEVICLQKDASAVWLMGNISSPLERHVIKVELDLGACTQVTQVAGQYRAQVQAEGKFFVASFSNLSSPSTTSVFDQQGKVLRVVSAPTNDRYRTLDIQPPKLLTIPARDGQPLQSMLIAPPHVDLENPGNRFPVLIHVYGGPRAPSVKNSWQSGNYWWHQYLAQNGIFVLLCDNRSALGQGNADTWKIYKNMGRIELEDLEDSVKWLNDQPWTDSKRIGMWGWSYGGYFTSYAMTHSKMFRAGIAGAPVTDWRNYDAVYTERYMDTPQNNASGYKSSSSVEAAAQLHGRLLIIHGERDDNVHMSNTFQLVHALQNASKPFDLMIYPRNRHGIVDPEQRYHMHQLMTDFLMKNLKADSVPSTAN